MLTVLVSLGVGALGAVASRAAVRYLAQRDLSLDPHAAWAIGLLGLVPGWLITFVALLGPSPAPRLSLWSAAAWVGSSAAALIGTIVTEALVRSASESGNHSSSTYWAWGLVTLLPAWGISIAGNVLR